MKQRHFSSRTDRLSMKLINIEIGFFEHVRAA
jgi:hypothetical protein